MASQLLLTEHGQFVLTKLGELYVLLLSIPGDNKAHNERLTREHLKRKASAEEHMKRMVESLPASQSGMEIQISYTGEDGAAENQPYTNALESFVGEAAVCKAIDLYHWYLRKVLQLALERDPSLLTEWAKPLELSAKKLAQFQSGNNYANLLSKLFRGRESVFRDLAHQHLRVPNLGTVPALVEVRNCIVHHMGVDAEGRLGTQKAACQRLGIKVEGGAVSVSTGAAYEAVTTVFGDLSIMDQALSQILSLPRSPVSIGTIRRVYQ